MVYLRVAMSTCVCVFAERFCAIAKQTYKKALSQKGVHDLHALAQRNKKKKTKKN